MIDVHCHLTEGVLYSKLEKVLADARNAAVKGLITSGTSYEDDCRVLEISDNRYVYASLGLMPYYNEDPERVIALAERNRDKIVAVGEVGLDYYLGASETRQRQQDVFRRFIEASREMDLPLVIHSRSAGKYALDLLISMGAERVVMHAFDGSAGTAERGAAKGYFFSIPPSVVRSEQKQKLVRRLSLENLLLESDAPALGPESGVVNYPCNLVISAEHVARLKGVGLERVVETTSRSAAELFRLQIHF